MIQIRSAMLAAVAIGGLVATSAADATPVSFDYEGVCIDGPAPDGERFFNCDAVGLFIGDEVFGSIDIDSAALGDYVITGEDIRDYGDFSFTFGDLSFNSGNSFISGFLQLDGAFNVIGGLLNMNNFFTAANTLTFTPDGGGLWSARRGFRWAGGVGGYSVVSVPEPGTLGLLGLGLLAVGFGRRMRKAQV